jgi:hypothetical protein
MALSYNYIESATTTQVKSGSGILHKIVVVTPVGAETIDLIDNTAGTTVNIGRITTTADLKPFYLQFDCRFTTGLRIITSGTSKITVVYQ